MAHILDTIVEYKRKEVAAAINCYGESVDVASRPYVQQRRRFADALVDDKTGIIAEFKRRSPSKGDIHPMADVSAVVPGYEKYGAAACSILTDTRFFGGAVTDLMIARKLVSLPLLRKDFIVHRRQIAEAALIGADAILLIASILTVDEVRDFADYAHSLGLDVLLEIHHLDELDHYCDGIDMVGVNNRDLRTFKTDAELSAKVIDRLPPNVVKIAESGLTSMAEVDRLRGLGYTGFLIGERFMKHSDPSLALHAFKKKNVNQNAVRKLKVKVCGNAYVEPLLEIRRADYVGFIFYPPSPRHALKLNPNDIPASRAKRVGVFVNEELEKILTRAHDFQLKIIQLHGNETPEFCETLKGLGYEVWKAVSISTPDDLQLVKAYEKSVDKIVLDTKTPGYGGSGKKFDWNILSLYDYELPFMLAGGIIADDAEELLEIDNPKLEGFDLNSGFEVFDGYKCAFEINRFIKTIKSRK